MVIITDGLENASTDFTRERVIGMISTQQDVFNWSFLFLAANQDAIAEGARMGIGAHQNVNFAATGAGVLGMSRRVSEAVSSVRITREDVPASVRASVEFQSACPASAVVMRRVGHPS